MEYELAEDSEGDRHALSARRDGGIDSAPFLFAAQRPANHARDPFRSDRVAPPLSPQLGE